MPYDQCYPRYAVLAYTVVVAALREKDPLDPEQIDAIMTVWNSLSGGIDQEFDTNFELMKEVSIIYVTLT